MVDDLAATHDPTTNTIPTRSWFDRTATWIVAGALAMGLLLALIVAEEKGAHEFRSWINVLCTAGYTIIAHGLAGLVLAALVRALGVWALAGSERPREPLRGDGPPPVEPPRSAAADAAAIDDDLAATRRSIELGEWDAADARLGDLIAEHPDDRRVERLVDQLRRAKQLVGERWVEQIRVAREVNDPNRVLELYAETPPVHDEEGRKNLDQDVAKWFLSLVHRRLRGGGIQVEIVTLAERVSESFAHTLEGASLRAALPTLRRSVGLCPRCAKPYVGTAEACPECLARKTAAASQEWEPTPEAEAAEVDELDALATKNRDSEWFVEGEDDDSLDRND